MSEIKLLALDLDGTLFTKDKQVTAENRAALKAAEAKGVHVVITTGRPLPAITHILEDLGLLDDKHYSVTFNGGLVQRNNGDILIKKEMSREDLKQIPALEAEEEEEAAASPFVLPFTLTLILTLDQVTVPVDLSIVPPLSAELGTKPPANFAVTFPTLSNLSLGNSLDRDFNTPSDSEVKVKLFPETSKNSLISVSLTSVITSQTFTEPSVWNLVLRSELVLEM